MLRKDRAVFENVQRRSVLSYEKKDEEERSMGYYNDARNAGFIQGFSRGFFQGFSQVFSQGFSQEMSQGYSLACENLSNLFRKLEDTGRQKFTIDDINAVLNELRSLSVTALEGNGDQVTVTKK